MTRHLVLSLVLTATAACGSKSPAPTTTPADPMASTSSATPAADPVVPADATTPAPDHEKEKADLLAVETAAYTKAKPAFDKYCASCHTKSGKKATGKKLGHFDMSSYPFGGAHAKSIGNEIRVVLAIDGTKKATMPSDKPGSVQGDDLAAIKAWTEAWQTAGAAGVHPAEPAEKDDD